MRRAAIPFPNQCIPFYWAHLELDTQESAEMDTGKDVLREALQGFSAQIDSCIVCPGLFFFQIQLLESGFPAQHCLCPSSPSLLIWHSHCVTKARRHGRGKTLSAKEKGRIMPRKSHYQASLALLATGNAQPETCWEKKHPDSTASSYRTFPPCEAAGK